MATSYKSTKKAVNPTTERTTQCESDGYALVEMALQCHIYIFVCTHIHTYMFKHIHTTFTHKHTLSLICWVCIGCLGYLDGCCCVQSTHIHNTLAFNTIPTAFQLIHLNSDYLWEGVGGVGWELNAKQRERERESC